LDRGIASLDWIHSFPHFSVTHLLAHTSDHNPIILDTNIPLPSLPRLFWFEEFWTRDPSCGIVIDEVWSTTVLESPSYCLSKKLKHTKKALKHWNKHFFGDIRTKLTSTLHLLDVSLQAPPSDSNLALELHLQYVISELLQQEESLWKNKSRELWLICKDLNTRFVHTSTLIRLKWNNIDRLFSPNVGWISDRAAIGRCFVTHFKDLFQTTNISPPSELLDLFQPSISDDDNLLICAIPIESKIYTALASLGRSKAPGPDGFIALFYLKY
jgi:hypothetical protein